MVPSEMGILLEPDLHFPGPVAFTFFYVDEVGQFRFCSSPQYVPQFDEGFHPANLREPRFGRISDEPDQRVLELIRFHLVRVLQRSPSISEGENRLFREFETSEL